jgi:3-hydroxyacyl-CoA dehydrogenase/enoyl-CoA hydratase/3-hydroxybutyryl-CoA epimerase
MTVATPPATSAARAFSQDLTPDGVLVLTLDVPGEKVNTLGKAMMQELLTLLGEIEARTDVRAIVLRSAKADNFIAGADIKDFTTIRSSLEGETLSRQGQGVLTGWKP